MAGIALFAALILAACVPITTPAANTPTPTPIFSGWEDRSPFQTGLVADHQNDLLKLAGASIYHINLELAAPFTTISGNEEVRYTNQESVPLNEIYFQLFPNSSGGSSTISDLSVDGTPVTPVFEEENSTMRVALPKALQPGEKTTIKLDFNLGVPTSAGGNYGLYGYIDSILVLDGFYPSIPVYDAQGWHKGQVPPNADTTFQDASFYLVRVTAPADFVLAASGVQTGKTVAGAQQVVTFAAGPARDFYLAGSKEFKVLTADANGVKVNSYYLSGSEAGAKLALDTAQNALEIYSARLGSYPYSEFDVVSTPMQHAYGIEYPGIVGINKDLYDLNSENNAINLEATVAHESGHQWFYNVVGNDQANQPWLDESLTQYITGLYYLDRYGESGWQGYTSSWESRWDRVDGEMKPIGLPAADYTGLEYGAIVYGRGPLFFEALAQKMGQADFDAFLRDYFQQNEWQVSSEQILKQTAEKECGCSLGDFFKEWVDQ